MKRWSECNLTVRRYRTVKASDGKLRESDVADMQGIFRIIQSASSTKAEFKMRLAEVWKELMKLSI